MDKVLKELPEDRGLSPAEWHRDRRWQRVKLRYELAKQQQQKLRNRDQLRLEREQAWDWAHERSESLRPKATVAYQSVLECPACASLNAVYPTNVTLATQTTTTWWERPGALTFEPTSTISWSLGGMRSQPRRQTIQARRQVPSILRAIVKSGRADLAATDACRRKWELSSAVRRRHNLDDAVEIEPSFWEIPISYRLLREHYQYEHNNQRMAERRARGNTPRQRPPRSSLSYSRSSADVAIDESMLQRMREEEEAKDCERAVRKVGTEVGYLYMVGEIDGLFEWREDYLRSNRELIIRRTALESCSVSSMSSLHTESDTEYSEDDRGKEADEIDFDEMDM